MDIAPVPFYPKYGNSPWNLLLGSPLWYFLIIWSGGPQGSGGPRGSGDWWWNIERQFDPRRSSSQSTPLTIWPWRSLSKWGAKEASRLFRRNNKIKHCLPTYSWLEYSSPSLWISIMLRNKSKSSCRITKVTIYANRSQIVMIYDNLFDCMTMDGKNWQL